MLVVCKKINEPLSKLVTTKFKVGKLYRYLNITEGDTTQYLVWGVAMCKKSFDECFEEYAPIVVKRVKQLGIYDEKKDKLVSKTAFIRDYADAHYYGKRGRGFYIIFVGNPRENCFGIVCRDMTKTKAFTFAYDVMGELLHGDITHIDTGHVKWFNRGIPISYNPMSEFYDDTFK